MSRKASFSLGFAFSVNIFAGDLMTFAIYVWNKVFKNGPTKICRIQPLNKKFKVIWSWKQTLLPQIFKSCKSHILHAPFLNTLSRVHFGCNHIFTIFIKQTTIILIWVSYHNMSIISIVSYPMQPTNFHVFVSSIFTILGNFL